MKLQSDPSKPGYDWKAEPDQAIEGAFVIRDASGNEVLLARSADVVEEVLNALSDAAAWSAVSSALVELQTLVQEFMSDVRFNAKRTDTHVEVPRERLAKFDNDLLALSIGIKSYPDDPTPRYSRERRS